eukprot:CAMPEP_0204575158 /NCGR_PEP_ID=MMETSP0661-20131031/41025_1 /ASSEMBLY_ACC=CAM_ASM_000606 /TAXON_ID=109239 /ORGANISM="Alexandrium margalefi, Strain AMGDE01CS-322" /LENGTH=266 /DNA_ID=CAMNT_0051583751 /DNA_START=61 /DNA_END=858 /DNA_ORIENTATION=-
MEESEAAMTAPLKRYKDWASAAATRGAVRGRAEDGGKSLGEQPAGPGKCRAPDAAAHRGGGGLPSACDGMMKMPQAMPCTSTLKQPRAVCPSPTVASGARGRSAHGSEGREEGHGCGAGEQGGGDCKRGQGNARPGAKRLLRPGEQQMPGTSPKVLPGARRDGPMSSTCAFAPDAGAPVAVEIELHAVKGHDGQGGMVDPQDLRAPPPDRSSRNSASVADNQKLCLPPGSQPVNGLMRGTEAGDHGLIAMGRTVGTVEGVPTTSDG